MADVVVVGAGISGIACARELRTAGHAVVVRDTGRRPGGRMALRRHDGRVVDIGASYFTVSGPDFAEVVDDWSARGLARPWTDTFAVRSPEGRRTTTGPVRWAAPGGLRGLVADLATGLDVRQADPVRSVTPDGQRPRVDDHPHDAVVLAMPDPQARRLLRPGHPVHAALDDPYSPSMVLTARWTRRTWADVDGIFVNDHPDLVWVADDGLRRGDRAPVLVAHATADRASRHLTDPSEASGPLLAALREVVDVPDEDPDLVHVQRWTFARPVHGRPATHHLGDDRIGACGDSWGPSSSVETAWRSGRDLGRALVERLS
ncbi:hypothetical protein HMPREF0063_11318 [Aeromicrobium marinum DSM 15272]|uniref:Amine oxidase domain-containing protein n=1 Tax=Aeromicrobium marinum DSM 15272 TaxID=585531 RepID=E2SBA9_9ACTN|nr:FAD-dependent oxidoreductase [Aeromicrobium marinum]EFQ83655.1 hypothetical protein HMPREF0063_11318 [Aeromicrobium marinum DSM 15272]